MIFIETPIFTDDLLKLMSDEEYAEFQEFLALNPTTGEVLRKIRWGSKGKGKRGGVRVIYYYVMANSQIRLLLIYQKGIQDDLTEAQKKSVTCNK